MEVAGRAAEARITGLDLALGAAQEALEPADRPTGSNSNSLSV
jgi:hypothetical protein